MNKKNPISARSLGNPQMLRFGLGQMRGSILLSTLVFTFVFLIMGMSLMGLLQQRAQLSKLRRAQLSALQIAEAGANYYRWHLAHAPSDYADGTGQTGCNPCGPYVHDYNDPSGGVIGQFSLLITPPPINSTVVKVKSTGWSSEFPTAKRDVAVRYGRPSWSRWAIVAHAAMRFGVGTETHGPVHSNNGIRFDGVAYNVVTSAVSSYTDTDSDACTGANSLGVHTCVDPDDPLSPAAPPSRPDVFAAGRMYSVTTVDFDSITVNLNDLQDLANDDGVYINNSNKAGTHVQFLAGGGFRYRTVKTTSNCTYGSGPPTTVATGQIVEYQGNWTTEAIPANGIIFVEDDVWVDGTLPAGTRVTLIAAKEPLASGTARIWINNDLAYAVQDGSTALGLIAQQDILIGLYSEDDLILDGAMIAQKGYIRRHYYPSSCSSTYYKRNSVTTFGSMATNQRYGFSWTCPAYCSGYNVRTLNFDSKLTYGPPPSFPVSGEYQFISWEELNPGQAF